MLEEILSTIAGPLLAGADVIMFGVFVYGLIVICRDVREIRKLAHRVLGSKLYRGLFEE